MEEKQTTNINTAWTHLSVFVTWSHMINTSMFIVCDKEEKVYTNADEGNSTEP